MLTIVHFNGLIVSLFFRLYRLARQIEILGLIGPVAPSSLQLIVVKGAMAQALLTLLG